VPKSLPARIRFPFDDTPCREVPIPHLGLPNNLNGNVLVTPDNV